MKKKEPFDLEFYLGMSKFDGPTHLIIIHQELRNEGDRLPYSDFLLKTQASSIFTIKK
jgi:hypothetical protein